MSDKQSTPHSLISRLRDLEKIALIDKPLIREAIEALSALSERRESTMSNLDANIAMHELNAAPQVPEVQARPVSDGAVEAPAVAAFSYDKQETPRTDALVLRGAQCAKSSEYVRAEDARQFERELADCLQQYERVKVERNGAIDRAQLCLDAKNNWADRARIAEAAMSARGDKELAEALNRSQNLILHLFGYTHPGGEEAFIKGTGAAEGSLVERGQILYRANKKLLDETQYVGEKK